MHKKIIALLLAFALLFLSGCGDNDHSSSSETVSDTPSTAKTATGIQLLFCENDTMNPYKTISKLNAELSYLLFDPLFKVDDSFEAVPVLAAKIESADKVYTVTLRHAMFSDGTPVTADDVIYSYNLAKESERFSYLFYEVSEVTSTDAGTVVFTLNVNDPYFSKLLTFPILKTGSDQLKNEDNVELVPIGTGKFVFDATGTRLIPNEKHYSAVKNIKEITLVNAPDNESMQHHVEVGATDIYYAQSTEDAIIRMSGKKQTVNLNNLVYLGINHNYAPLKSAELRYAISSAISRNELINSAFYSNAISATGFFHPEWEEVSGYQTIQSSADLKICVENLEKIGYNRLNAEGYYENSNGNIVELTLLVNNENYTKLTAANLIANQLKNAGIKITVNAVGKDAYFSALSSGAFQLYIGEVKLLPNMDLRSIVLPNGSSAYGMVASTYTEPATEEDTQEQTAENTPEHSQETEDVPEHNSETSYISVVKGLYDGTNTAVDVASSLLAGMPIIPLAYRNSIVFYSNRIENIGDISSCDIFISIDKYKLKK